LFEEHENCAHIVTDRDSQIQILTHEKQRLLKIKQEFETEMDTLKDQMTEFEGLISSKET
jgi:hypothetical protein